MEQFSSHLFWDIARESVNLDEHRNWLVKRVLEKGTLEDWKLLQTTYSRDGIREAVIQLRSLEKKARSFACAILGIHQTELRCFKNKSSPLTHWDY